MMEEYLGVFVDETREYLQNLNDTLLKLEETPEDMELINDAFRALHTLKGMAGTMGFNSMAKLCHSLENVLDKARNGEIKITSDLLDKIFAGVDMIARMVDKIVSEGTDEIGEDIEVFTDTIRSFVPSEGNQRKKKHQRKTLKSTMKRTLHRLQTKRKNRWSFQKRWFMSSRKQKTKGTGLSM